VDEPELLYLVDRDLRLDIGNEKAHHPPIEFRHEKHALRLIDLVPQPAGIPLLGLGKERVLRGRDPLSRDERELIDPGNERDMPLDIRKVTESKKEYIDLLLLADEQEDMVDQYLERGEMFILDDGGVKAECVVTKESDGVYELKNIAVEPCCQRKGYGKCLIEFLFSHYADCKTMLVGTGDVPSILNFYGMCGFTESHRIGNFFADNYDHPMYENGIQLVDMVYLKRER
jgi:ribosomal protein S18 acetylase RimI-like enzyme